MDFTIVKWNDASYVEGDLDAEKINTDCILVTCGFIVKENKKMLTIAAEYFKEEDTWKHIINIPKSLIIERQDYEP